jgi:3'-5' exoribonuclease
MEISDVKDGTLFYDLHALVVKKTLGVTKTGKDFADILLRSGNDVLKCKKWNYNTAKYDDLLTVGNVVKVSGEASLYQDEIQGKLETIEPSDKSPEDFARRTRFDVDKLYSDIMLIIDSFTEVLPQYVAFNLLTTYKTEFCRAPAAKGVHQPWLGGLLEHTHSMLSLALPIINHYQAKYGLRYFSRDLILCGVVIHDLGKIFEYDTSTPAFKLTPNGLLANHIVRGSILVHEAAEAWYRSEVEKNKTPDKLIFERARDHLIHLVASHHGTHEWGSPVLPSTLEAIILHQLDKLDSSFMHALDLVENKEGEIAGFSERSWIEKVQFLRN